MVLQDLSVKRVNTVLGYLSGKTLRTHFVNTFNSLFHVDSLFEIGTELNTQTFNSFRQEDGGLYCIHYDVKLSCWSRLKMGVL